MLVKKIPALRPPLIKGLQMLAKFFVRDKEYKTNDYITPTVSRCQRCQGVKNMGVTPLKWKRLQGYNGDHVTANTPQTPWEWGKSKKVTRLQGYNK